MDNPAEYISQLEADLRVARSANKQLERERDALQAELAEADALRSAVADGAVDAAHNMQVACERIELWEPVIVAAIAWEAHESLSPESDPDVTELVLKVRALNKALAKRAQS